LYNITKATVRANTTTARTPATAAITVSELADLCPGKKKKIKYKMILNNPGVVKKPLPSYL